MKSRGRENRCSVSSELPRRFLLCFFGWLQTHLCPELFQTSTFIRSLYHLVLAGSHPLRSHHVGNLIICQHQTYIRAGICSCSLFLQMIGALPLTLTFGSYQEPNHSLLNIVSFSFSCEPNLSSHLWASHMCANTSMFSLSKTSLACVKEACDFFGLAVLRPPHSSLFLLLQQSVYQVSTLAV